MDSFLTRRQKEILEFIAEFQRREGVSPTHREICERFGFSSYGTAPLNVSRTKRQLAVRGGYSVRRNVRIL